MVEGIGQRPDAVRNPGGTNGAPSGRSKSQNGLAFRDVLADAVRGELKLSSHAQSRLQSSRIDLTSDDMDRLTHAVDQAAKKGARESLILMDNVAFVVSVKNRTVITAVGPDRVKENVFTNIDSAVIT